MRKMWSVALVLAGAFLFTPVASAQFTTVTATVKDPNGIPYAGAVLNAVLVPSTGGGYTLSGQPYSGRIGPVTLDSSGSFTVNFGDVTLITPGSPQWQITIDSAAATIMLPLGTGPQTFTFTSTGTTISGSSPVSLTTSLNALAPKLTNFITGGTGSVTSVAATSPIVATPSPITVAGTISCPTCNTSGATIAGTIANTQVAFGTAANTIGGNAGFIFVTPNLTIPVNGSYNIGTVSMLSTPPSGGTPGNNISVGGPSNMSAITNTAVNNVAVGSSVMTLTTTGQANTAVGVGALQLEGATNQKNTAIGHATLAAVTSDTNTAVGDAALTTLTSGGNNVAVGAGAGGNATTGSNNTLVGPQAGLNLSTGGSNVIVGAALGNVVSSGSSNLAIGVATLANITATSSNQMDIMDVLVGTGMNVPATSTVEFKGNVTVDGTCTGCSGTPTFPVTVAGTVTSGGIPYFNSTTQESSSAVLTNHVIVTGGGAGGAPTIGNGDFTIDSTAHTLLAGASGLVDLTAETGASAFKLPIGNCTASANGGLCYNTTTANLISAGNFVVELTSIPGTNCLFKNASASAARGSCSALVDAGTNVVSSEPVSATAYLTGTNCSSSASPAVCGSAAAGSVVIAVTATTVTVNTTAVTANSQIDVGTDDTLGTKLGVTCNSTLATLIGGLAITARTAGTSFQITSGATPAVNPLCISYHITN